MKPDPGLIFEELLEQSGGFDHSCFLHSNSASGRHYDWLVALGAKRVLTASAGNALEKLRLFQNNGSGWLFGYLGYDLKNETCQPQRSVGKLTSLLPDRIGFPDLCWFEPEYLFVCENGAVRQLAGDHFPRREPLSPTTAAKPLNGLAAPQIQCDFQEGLYAQSVESLRRHVREGDVYEVNLCATFFMERTELDPLQTFRALNERSLAPFSGWFRAGDRHLFCASPERFLARSGNRVWSQPIKGTAARGLTTTEDAAMAEALKRSEKDRAENVMIVDLVRNDLARCCQPGSIQVPVLCELNTFATLHHLISTVEGQLLPGTDVVDVLRATFPMGSMTGAPKIMALELIERYEQSRRGLFSGALGYLKPGGDFDLNVVIRSLLYHSGTGTVVWPAGGAITWDSEPLNEWKEILTKAAAMETVVIGHSRAKQ